MSTIQEEITRISDNMSDALNAVAGKGVSVPQGANSDDLASLISAIPAGGQYLPLSGGTITAPGTENSPLTIKSGSPYTSAIMYKNSLGETLGSLGVNDDNKPIFNNNEIALAGNVISKTEVLSSSDAATIRTNLGFYKTLKSGIELAVNGKVTVSGINDYHVFALVIKSGSTSLAARLLAVRGGNYIMGMFGQAESNGEHRSYAVQFTVDGEELTLVSITRLTHTHSGSHSALTNLTVTSIIGIL